MDVKTKANFINSVSSSQKIPCPICNSLNESDAMFCFSCGNKLLSSNDILQNARPISCPSCNERNEVGSVFCAACGAKLIIENNEISKRVLPNLTCTDVVESEEISVFAQGLPPWNIVPPQVMVRRKKKK